MLNCIEENSMFSHPILVINIPRIGIALVVAIVLALVCFNIVSRIKTGIRDRCFQITDAWEIKFGEKPFFFYFLMLVYLLALLIITYLGGVAVYELCVK